jgi:alkylation response protein AidB-like acyl-CoA dehydrogenase
VNVDYRLTDEQRILRDMLSAYLSDNYGAANRAALADDQNFPNSHWRRFANELGILAVPLPSEFGGFGDTGVETMLVMEAFGSALVSEPFLESSVIACDILARAGGDPAKERLGSIASGDVIVALAHWEARSRYDLACVATRATENEEGYILDGEKALVVGAPWANDLIVSARLFGNERDEDGVLLCLVPIATAGVSRRDYATIDGRRASEVSLKEVKVMRSQVLGPVGGAVPFLRQTMNRAAIALSAEGVGCMRAMLAATIEHAKNRRQFGKPLSAFQVLRHAMVDMFVMIEKASALTHSAALEPAKSPELGKWAAAARAMTAKAAKAVGENAIQIHGAIGTTDELLLGAYFKRLTVLRQQFGDLGHFLDQYSQQFAQPQGDQMDAANPPSTVTI